MKEIKIKLLIDAVLIQVRRDKITIEAAIATYPALTNDEKAAITAALP